MKSSEINIHASWNVLKKESCLVRSTSSIDFHASYLFLKLHKHTIQPVDRNSSNNP